MTNLQSFEFFVPDLIIVITIVAALITDLFLKRSKTDVVGWVLGIGFLTMYMLSLIHISEPTRPY